ncbi:hypothetical protein PLUTE_a5210 [Pseudoalteromonas luteoviolacea DSM 6061]|nr:hypothetical protein [Pseudoalteromonas luteoviolacea DSM 6061]
MIRSWLHIRHTVQQGAFLRHSSFFKLTCNRMDYLIGASLGEFIDERK